MFHRPRDTGSGHGGQRRDGVMRLQLPRLRHNTRKTVTIQRFRRHFKEIRVLRECAQHLFRNLAFCRQSPACVKSLIKKRKDRVIDRCIGGPGVKGKQRALSRRIITHRIDPSKVAHTAQVEKGHRLPQGRKFRHRMVIKGRERRALSAELHVRAAEIPDHGFAHHFSQNRAIARLMGAHIGRVMGESLTMKSDEVIAFQMGQRFGVGGLYELTHLGGRLP